MAQNGKDPSYQRRICFDRMGGHQVNPESVGNEPSIADPGDVERCRGARDDRDAKSRGNKSDKR